MRVLVTGGAGFIGSHIVEHFQEKAEVVMLDDLRSGFRGNLEGFDIESIESSITGRDIIKKAVNGVDYVFHLTAMISVPESMGKPAECVFVQKAVQNEPITIFGDGQREKRAFSEVSLPLCNRIFSKKM